MRYEGTRPSRRDKEVDVYVFAMGMDEIRNLRAVTTHYLKSIPKTLETMPLRQRLNDIDKAFSHAIIHRKLERLNYGQATTQGEVSPSEGIRKAEVPAYTGPQSPKLNIEESVINAPKPQESRLEQR